MPESTSWWNLAIGAGAISGAVAAVINSLGNLILESRRESRTNKRETGSFAHRSAVVLESFGLNCCTKVLKNEFYYDRHGDDHSMSLKFPSLEELPGHSEGKLADPMLASEVSGMRLKVQAAESSVRGVTVEGEDAGHEFNDQAVRLANTAFALGSKLRDNCGLSTSPEQVQEMADWASERIQSQNQKKQVDSSNWTG